MKYQDLSPKPDFSSIHEEVSKFWKDEKIFEKSVDKQAPEVVFYDGPPFPTGKPHHGTVLVSFIKDLIARYWTMRGYSVPRTWGWDCHGLPIENQAETLMGITDKNEIENSIGIDKFNEKCFEIVSNNNEAWRQYIDQMARWVDYDNAYKTMTPNFMESVMWAFKTCYDKGLIYKDYRVTPYCTHCETSLSISDTRESDSTRPRQDRWVAVKFKTELTKNGKPVYFLAWTTTPWTLPSNLCLAVGEKLTYAFVEVGDEILVAGKDTLKNFKNVFGAEPNIVDECNGAALVGNRYEPLFPYFANLAEQGAFRVVAADYVGAEEGVGIVHTAPAFGEDDYWTCKNNGIPLVNPVDTKGRFTSEITDFYPLQGEKNVIELNPIIIRFLYEHKKAVADGTIEHNYPHCWRCKRPLIYKAMDAYYFDIGKIKDRLIETNEEINWVPDTVKHGRFGNWLEGARDWNISRNRYWSTPIPIWKCDCDECSHQEVLGSIDEIYEKSGMKLNDLHRQFMDKVTYKCPKCGGTMHRVPEVLDCWFESGSVPFAQKHYPFENKEWFDSHFPCDFIVEYTGQIRCWFYYLHVLAVALFDKPTFKNCVVHGTILAKDGKKLSKSSKNYTDPMELMQKYGTDSLRLYLYQTNAMLIGDLMFDDNGVLEAFQQFILPWWNACNFFVSYANIDGFVGDPNKIPESDNQLDKWVLAKLYTTEKAITQNMEDYQIDRYVDHLLPLVDGITNWYIRRSRRRFWTVGMDADKQNAYETLYYVLVNTAKLFAPVAPIIAEKIYKLLTPEYSVHLADWPKIPESFRSDELVESVDLVQDIITLARSIRSKNRVKNRQPLSTMQLAMSDPSKLEQVRGFADVIAEELNVKNVELIADVGDIAKIKYDPNFAVINAKVDKTVKGKVIQAIKGGKYRLEGDNAILTIDGAEVAFDADVILVTYIAKEGLFVASQGDIVVSLDLTVTEELRREGFAREIIRNIQDARKQLGCEITDRIAIEIMEGEMPAEWVDFICSETLSSIGIVGYHNDPVTVDGDGYSLTLVIGKVLL
ncbi:MAG: isoleucine--tRNA ligase [Clostridia bacterium]|nr:isoleucine--tRNA ligase [Clostridia bacterium]